MSGVENDDPLPLICQRIDAALEVTRFRAMEVRAIYLDAKDQAEFDRANTRYWRKVNGSRAKFFATTYRGHAMRSGKTSRIYSTHGVDVCIRKRLPAKTLEAAA